MTADITSINETIARVLSGATCNPQTILEVFGLTCHVPIRTECLVAGHTIVWRVGNTTFKSGLFTSDLNAMASAVGHLDVAVTVSGVKLRDEFGTILRQTFPQRPELFDEFAYVNASAYRRASVLCHVFDKYFGSTRTQDPSGVISAPEDVPAVSPTPHG